jgi:hypothetical protein
VQRKEQGPSVITRQYGSAFGAKVLKESEGGLGRLTLQGKTI